jgi:hypothetical protein
VALVSADLAAPLLIRVMPWKAIIIGSVEGSIMAIIITVIRAKNNPSWTGPIGAEGIAIRAIRGSEVDHVTYHAAEMTSAATMPMGAASWRAMLGAVIQT